MHDEIYMELDESKRQSMSSLILPEKERRRLCGQWVQRILFYFLKENLRQRQRATVGIEGEVKTIHSWWYRHINLGKIQGIPIHGHVVLERDREGEKEEQTGQGNVTLPTSVQGQL